MIPLIAILLSFSVHIEGPHYELKGSEIKIVDKGYSLPSGSGVPAIPQKTYFFAVPSGMKVTRMEIKSIRTVKPGGKFEIPPVPSPAILDIPGIKFEAKPPRKDPQIYGSSRFYPDSFVNFDGFHTLLGAGVASVTVVPYRYNPVSGEIEILRSVDIEFETVPDKRSVKKTRWGRDFVHSVVRGLVENPEDVHQDFVPINQGMDYLIVTPSRFADVFDSLARWYRRFGIRTTIRTTEWITTHYAGRDLAEKVRNYARICYQDSGLTALLLGGDVEYVPARVAYAMTCEAGFVSDEDSIRADLYFSDLDGSWDENGNGTFGETADSIDLYPDIIVGRAPVRNTREVQTFIRKVIAYEAPYFRDYQNRALFFAEVLWHDPFTDASIGKEMIDSLYVPGHIYITKLYETRGNESSSSVASAINSGVNFLNHDGHGWYNVMGTGADYMGISDVQGLSNGLRCGILFSIGCWVGAFDRDAISEYFIRNENGGGVAFIGNSRYGWGSPGNPGYGYSDRFDSEFYGTIFERNVPYLGAALALDKVLFIPYSRDENVYRWHQYQLNLLGDPLMPVWKNVPQDLRVTAPDTVVAGSNFRISTFSADSGRATITQGNDILDVVKFWGSALLHVPSGVTGEIVLGVYVPGHVRLLKNISVIHHGAFPGIDTVLVRDSSLYADSIVSPGETGILKLVFKNSGNDTSEPTGVHIDEITGILDLHPDSFVISGLSPEEEETVAIFYSASHDTGHAVLRVSIAGDSTSWILPVMRPYLMGRTSLISGTLNPGDSGEIEIWIKNETVAPARDVTVMLSSGTPGVYVQDTVYFPEIAARDSSVCTVSVYVDPSIIPGSTYEIGVEYSVSGYTGNFTLQGIVGVSAYRQDFEGNLNGWRLGSRWLVGERRAHSGTKSLYCGTPGSWRYGNNWNSSIESPEIVVSFNPTLSFWLWYEVATYGSDGIYVEIVHGNETDTIDFIGSGGALDSTLSFVNSWAQYDYDLNFLNPGDTIRVRLRFVSDGEDNAEGFYVDDFSITGESIVSPVGIDEDEVSSFEILLSSGMFKVTVIKPMCGSLKIFDSSGRLVRKIDVKGPGVLEVRGLMPGIYFVKYANSVKRAVIVK